ncbi:hypothetical protein [Neisseria dumasiana]|nr:hypothetical protein [Neisseria dumasiana]
MRESRRHLAFVFFIMGMSAELVGVAMAGVAATGGYVIRPYGWGR